MSDQQSSDQEGSTPQEDATAIAMEATRDFRDGQAVVTKAIAKQVVTASDSQDQLET